MAWILEFDEVALKQLKKLPKEISREIMSYLISLRDNKNHPQDFGKPLLYEKKGLWRYRVGKYRIICKIEDSQWLILVVKIGKRDKIYT